MGGDTGRLWEEIKERLLRAGFSAVGIARAGLVDPAEIGRYEEWLMKGMAGEMDYMHNHRKLREDPRLLLEGAESIICMAYDYTPQEGRDRELPVISAYALLPDYHEMLRALIRRCDLSELLGKEGEDWRICVDSAPIMERYWAEQTGIGQRGKNGMLTVPGIGNQVFLAEILTTKRLEPEERREGKEEKERGCLGCGACKDACPTGALQPNGEIDSNRCLSYLTIEHRGPWKEGVQQEAMHTAAGRHTLFGCDRCITSCPLNRNNGGPNAGLAGIMDLGVDDILTGDIEKLKARLKGSSLKRAKRDGLARNASNIAEVSQ